MKFVALLCIPWVAFALVACTKSSDWTVRHADYLERERVATQIYSGADIDAAEKSLLTWKRFVEGYKAPDVNNEPTLGLIAYRLYLIRQHQSDHAGASRYLQESMEHIQRFRSSKGHTNEVARQEFLASMQRDVKPLWQDKR